MSYIKNDPINGDITNDTSDLTINGKLPIDQADGDARYVEVAGDTMTGSLTLANQADALDSGDYSLQFLSGKADGASAVGYVFDTTSLLDDATAVVEQHDSGGTNLYDLIYDPTGGLLGFFPGTVFKASGTGQYINFELPVSGEVNVLESGTTKGLRILPNAGGAILRTYSAGNDADPVIINFNNAFVVGQDTTHGNSLHPLAPTTLGTALPGEKWNGLYLGDSDPVYFGIGNDATIQWDGTDLVIDPTLVSSGVTRFVGEVHVPHYIRHFGDSDTWMFFTSDRVQFNAGGDRLLDLFGTTNEVVVNENGTALDFRVEGDTDTHLIFSDGSADAVGIGDSTPTEKLHVNGNIALPKTSGNGIMVDAAGTPAFGYRDILGQITVKGSGANDPSWAQIGSSVLYAYQFDITAGTGDACWISFHIPHDYKEGTDVFFHAHWMTTSTDTTNNVIWRFDYMYADGHDQGPFPVASVSNISTTGIPSGGQYYHMVTETAAVTLDLEPDGIIYVKVSRTDNGGTNPSPVFLLQTDVHYQSTNIATKNRTPDFYT